MSSREKKYNTYDEGHYMEGPFMLDTNGVAYLDDDAFGVYVLIAGASRGQDILTTYVGRGNLRQRLQAHRKTSDAEYFAYVELESEEGAYLEECRLFHKYGKRKYLDNKEHPKRPPRSVLPKCSQLGCDGEPD